MQKKYSFAGQGYARKYFSLNKEAVERHIIEYRERTKTVCDYADKASHAKGMYISDCLCEAFFQQGGKVFEMCSEKSGKRELAD